MVRIFSILTASFLMTACTGPQAPKGDTGDQGPPGQTIVIIKEPPVPPTPKPAIIIRPKFSGTWTNIYDSNLSPQQHAFCVADANRKEFKSYDDWVVLINEVPKRRKEKVIGFVETKCSVSKAIFPEEILDESYDEGIALYVTGDVKDDSLHVEKFVRVN